MVEVLSNLDPVQRRAFFVAFCVKRTHIKGITADGFRLAVR